MLLISCSTSNKEILAEEANNTSVDEVEEDNIITVDGLEDDNTITVEELEEDELPVLATLTDELRTDGFKYCLIETQNEEEEILSHRLRISVKHLV